MFAQTGLGSAFAGPLHQICRGWLCMTPRPDRGSPGLATNLGFRAARPGLRSPTTGRVHHWACLVSPCAIHRGLRPPESSLRATTDSSEAVLARLWTATGSVDRAPRTIFGARVLSEVADRLDSGGRRLAGGCRAGMVRLVRLLIGPWAELRWMWGGWARLGWLAGSGWPWSPRRVKDLIGVRG